MIEKIKYRPWSLFAYFIKSFSLFTALIICFISCDNKNQPFNEICSWMIPDGKIKILSTTAMINDVVKQIAGEHADTLTLIQGNLDPHSYQLVKGDDEKLKVADLIFYNGLGLEHGASLQHTLEDHPNAVSLGKELFIESPSRMIYVSGQVDPHIWMDMALFSEIIPVIVERLSAFDHVHEADYHRNGEKLKYQLLHIHHELRTSLHKIPAAQRYLVTSHDAFNYFARAYLAEQGEMADELWRDRFQAPEGLAPDSQLSSTDLQLILNHLKKYRSESYFLNLMSVKIRSVK